MMEAHVQAKRILVVDDEVLAALDVEDALIEAGFCVVGPAHRLDQALAFARDGELDAAVLDVNLAGVQVWPVADLLFGRGVPIVLLTGSGKTLAVPQSCKNAPLINKPVHFEELLAALTALLAGVRSPSRQACPSRP